MYNCYILKKVILIFFITVLSLFASQNKDLNLNEEEQNWLLNQKEIKIGIQKNWVPLSYTQNGIPKGLGVDYIRLLNEKLDGKLIIIADSFKNNLEKVKNGTLDAMIDITPTDERRKIYSFTTPYADIPHYIVASKNSKDYFGSIEELSGKTVAVEKGYGIIKKLKDNVPGVKFKYYNNTTDALEALSAAKADAYVGNRAVVNYIMQNNFITNLSFHGKSTVSRSVLAIGVDKNKEILRDILQKAYDDITIEEKQEIFESYVGKINKKDKRVKLTPEEEKWILEHKTVKVGGENDWPPFDFVDSSGNYLGISKDIMDLVSKKTGLKFEYVTGQTWKELMEDFKNGKLEILPAMYKNKAREEYTIFTNPYFTIKDYIFSRDNDDSIKSVNDLENKKVAIIDGYAIEYNLRSRFPRIDLLKVKNKTEGLNAVLLNKADVYIDGLAVVLHTLKSDFISGLKPVIPVDFYSNDLHIGINKASPVLASIVKQGLDSISSEEKEKVVNKWIMTNDENSKVKFTKEEKEWIKNNPVIKVGSGDNWPPFNYMDSDGEFKGITKDYLDLISKISGLKIDLVASKWKNVYGMFLDGKLHMLPAALYNKEREKIGRFLKPHIKLRDFIYARADDDTINAFKDLNGKTLVRIKGYATLDPYLPFLKDVRIIEVNNMLEMINAVYNKKADAFLEAQPSINHILKENMIGGLKSIAQSVVAPTTAHMLIKKDEKILYSIIQKSMKNIPDQKRNEIYDRWVRLESDKFKDLKLNEREKEWLQKNKTIRIVSGPAWPPFDFYDKKTGTYKGIGQNYFQKISELTGIKFKHLKVKSWDDAIEKMKSRDADMFTIAQKTSDRLKFMSFTDTIISYPIVIVSSNDVDFVSGIDALWDKKIVLIKNFAITEIIKRDYPNLDITEVKDAYEALSYVSKGKAYAFLGSLGTVTYAIKDGGFFNLKIAGKTEYKFSWGAAVRNDWPAEAVSVLNKALNAISEEEKNKIYNKWITLELEESIDYTLLYKIVGIFTLLTLVTLYWNRKIFLARKFTNTIMDSQVDIVITSDGEKIITANSSFMDFFNIGEIGQFEYDCICDMFEKKEGYLQKRVDGKLWVEYVIQHPDIHHKVIIKGHIFSLKVTETQFGRQKIYVAVLSDITKIEEARKELEEQKEQTEQILSNILLPILITSKRTRKILYANEHAQKQYEKPLEEIIGSEIDDIYTSKEQQLHILEAMKKDGKIQNSEELFKTFRGKEFSALLSVTPIKYHNEDAFIGMVTDITRQKKIEEELKESHLHTKSSIEYASLIQHAIIPDDMNFRKYFKDFFTLWEPKDIVGGDIYLFNELKDENECLLMVIDCTGHGVPGAFVTMLVKAIERQVSTVVSGTISSELSTAWVLEYFNKTMKHLLQQEEENSISNAGFDAGVLYYNKKEKIVKFSGAEIPLFYMQNGECRVIKGDRHSIGYKKSKVDYEFKEHIIDIKGDMQLYLTTDGYLDQNGGEKGFPLGKKRFKGLIEENHDKPFAMQKQILLRSLKKYQQDEERNDDVTVVGIKI